MKSVIRDGRSVPRVEEVPRPAARGGEVLVRTVASLVRRREVFGIDRLIRALVQPARTRWVLGVS